MLLFSVLLLIVGLAIVVLSADEAIKRLLNLAGLLRLSEFTVSFVLAGVLAILPELSIGILAALGGSSSLGYGVILGANVADLTLVIGIAVLFGGHVDLEPAMLKSIRLSSLAVLLPVILFYDGEISRFDGAILIVVFLIYVTYMLRSKHDGGVAPAKRSKRRVTFEAAILTGSILLLFVGGSLITDNSQGISMEIGLPLFVVGLIVAVGTCLPEMAFSIRACSKKYCHVGLGNILGNVLADSLLTIGVIALMQPIKPAVMLPPLSTGIFMAVSALAMFLLSRDGTLKRKDGALLLVLFGLFVLIQFIIQSHI